MAWATISALETAPGARILQSLMFRIRDNPIETADQGSIGVPASERPRLPQCLRTVTGGITTALASGGVGAVLKFVATPKWNLRAFQTAGAWTLAGGVAAREYFIEMWGAGATNDSTTKRGGGSGAYTSLRVSVGIGVAIGGVVGTGGAGGGVGAHLAGTDTTLATGPGTGIATGAPATGAGAAAGSVGGTSVAVALLAGFASSVVNASTFGSRGATPPMLGGTSHMENDFSTTQIPGAGGSAPYNAAGGTRFPGGNGMVLVWYLE